MTSSPGAFCVVANATDWSTVTPDVCRVILDLSSLSVAQPPTDRLEGIYASMSPDNLDFQDEAFHAERLGVRLYVAWDNWNTFPLGALKEMPASAVPLLELYQAPRQDPTESLSAAIARWTRNATVLEAMWSWYWGVIPQDYLGGTTLDRVLAAQVPSVDLINAHPRCKVSLSFAWDRSNGGQIPVLAQCQVNLCAASPGPATLLPVTSAGLPQAHLYGGPMNVYMKLGSKYIGVDPAKPTVVYADRDVANGWEAITLTQLPDKRFSAKFDAAGVYLSITDLNELETRTAVGPWESHCAINPPVEYSTTPSELYQPTHGVILQVEQQ